MKPADLIEMNESLREEIKYLNEKVFSLDELVRSQETEIQQQDSLLEAYRKLRKTGSGVNS